MLALFIVDLYNSQPTPLLAVIEKHTLQKLNHTLAAEDIGLSGLLLLGRI